MFRLYDTHDADCSVEPVSAGRLDSVYQVLTSPTTAGSPADDQKITSRKRTEIIFLLVNHSFHNKQRMCVFLP